ncbi:MAG: DUF3108 domain-containing protein [Porphyromonadaceae bacterium]|nr:DUF3108 domain-containing protein [Porphyromonadaceae bacterium]
MKNRIKTVILGLIIAFSAHQVKAQAWEIKSGENLKYRVAFSSGLTGNVKGGEATLSVKPSTTKIGSNTTYHATLKGGTTGIIEWFYQVSNNYETFIDTQTNAPVMYRQTVRENKYTSSDTVYFDQAGKTATYKGKKISIPNNTHDFVSMIYYVRTLDMAKMKKGDSFTLPFFTADKVVNSQIIYNGIENIRANGKTVSCYAFKPQVGKGKMFNQDYPATIWISADSKRIPMLIEARMKVGKVKMELTGR